MPSGGSAIIWPESAGISPVSEFAILPKRVVRSAQARSSVAERSYHMGEVRGSIPFRAYRSKGDPKLFGGKAPCPGCTNDSAALFGDKPEIPRSLPADEIFGYARNGLRRLCVGLIPQENPTVAQGHPGRPDGSQDRTPDLLYIHIEISQFYGFRTTAGHDIVNRLWLPR